MGDLDGDGVPEVINGGLDPEFGFGIVTDGRRREFDHMLGAWNVETGMFVKGFPRQVEDIQFFMNPAVADIDDDGQPEVIGGSGGFLLHAFNYRGEEPEGWPKNTAGWITSSPAVHDLDGDELLEVVTATRSGFLFAWNTSGSLYGDVQWSSFHHDSRNSGNFHVDLQLPDPPETSSPPSTEDPAAVVDCECSAGGSARGNGALVLLALSILARRRCR